MAMAVRRAAGVDWDAYRGPRTTKKGGHSVQPLRATSEATQPPPRASRASSGRAGTDEKPTDFGGAEVTIFLERLRDCRPWATAYDAFLGNGVRRVLGVVRAARDTY